MKACFSTLGCPDWSFDDILATAVDFGYKGIEIRGIANEIYVPAIPCFDSKKAESTKAKLQKARLDIVCLDSAAYLYEENPKYMAEAKAYIDTAAAFAIPYVRVLGDKDPQPGKEIDTAKVMRNLAVLNDYAKATNVTVLIETNGVFADSAFLKKQLDAAGLDHVGVLWDIHHPYRYFNETPETTYQNLQKYIRHIHIKDSVLEKDAIRYKMLLEGDVPIVDTISLLKKNAYDGYISLEWVKRWYQDLEEPGIVFMHFIDTIQTLWNTGS